jgi:hypothetical protein
METTIKEKAHKIYKEAIIYSYKMIREEPYFRGRLFFYNRIGIDNEMQKELYYHIQNLVYIFCRQEVLKEDNNTKSKLAFYLAWHIFMQNYKTKMYIKEHKEYIIKEAHENIKKNKNRNMYFDKVINYYDLIHVKFINDQDALDDFVEQNKNCYYRSKEDDLILKRKKEPFLYFAIKSFYKDLHLYEEGFIKEYLDIFKKIKNELFRICEIDNKVSNGLNNDNDFFSYFCDTIEVGEFASNIYIVESQLYNFFQNLNLDYYLKFKFMSDKQTITFIMPILEKQYSSKFMLDEETIESHIIPREGRYKFRSTSLF